MIAKILPTLLILFGLLGSSVDVEGSVWTPSPCVTADQTPESFTAICLNTTVAHVYKTCHLCELQGGPCISATNPQWIRLKITGHNVNMTVWPSIITQNLCFRFDILDDVDPWGNWRERAWGYFYDSTCTTLLFETPAYALTLKKCISDFAGRNQLCQEYIPGPIFSLEHHDPVTSFKNAYITTEFADLEDGGPFEIKNELIKTSAIFSAIENSTFEGITTLFNNLTKHVDSISTLAFEKIAPPSPLPVWPSSFPPPPPPPPSFAKRDVSFNPQPQPQPYYQVQGLGRTFKIPQSAVPAEHRKYLANYLKQ